MAPSMSVRLSLALVIGALKQSDAVCEDLANMLNTSTCVENVKWAKETGIKTVPTKYKDFPFIKESSSLEDFQYVLSIKDNVNVGGSEDSCPSPCTMSPEATTFEKERRAEIAADKKLAEEEATTTAAPSVGLKWWGWLLIVLGVCCCLPLLGLACSAFICYESIEWIFGSEQKRAPKKAKRGITTPAAPVPAPAPVQTTSVPMSMIVAPPVYVASPTYATSSVAQNHMYMQQAPAYMSAPAAYATTAQPMYAQPYQATAASYAQPYNGAY